MTALNSWAIRVVWLTVTIAFDICFKVISENARYSLLLWSVWQWSFLYLFNDYQVSNSWLSARELDTLTNCATTVATKKKFQRNDGFSQHESLALAQEPLPRGSLCFTLLLSGLNFHTTISKQISIGSSKSLKFAIQTESQQMHWPIVISVRSMNISYTYFTKHVDSNIAPKHEYKIYIDMLFHLNNTYM